MTQFFLVRHGNTKLNDEKEERIRAFSDVPLDENGIHHAHEVGKFLQAYPVVHVISSPLQRAMMTAHIISEHTSADTRPDRHLLPWDLGDLQGKLLSEVKPRMQKLQEYPDLKAPHGESYSDFYYRWQVGLENMIRYAESHHQENLVGVVHSRNMLALRSLLGDRDIGKVPVKGGPGPASIVRVWKTDDDEWDFETVLSQ